MSIDVRPMTKVLHKLGWRRQGRGKKHTTSIAGMPSIARVNSYMDLVNFCRDTPDCINLSV